MGILLHALTLLPADHRVLRAGSPYVVNTTSDTVAAGACDNNTAGCSLRGAIEAANVDVASLPSNSTFPHPTKCIGGVCTIDLADKLPSLSTDRRSRVREPTDSRCERLDPEDSHLQHHGDAVTGHAIGAHHQQRP